MTSYHITEPHPTALPNHYIHTGRGGAGNTIRISPTTSSSSSTKSPPALSQTPSHSSLLLPHPSSKASTGRGGAGNIYPATALSHFSLSDALHAQVLREQGHDRWHVGRGGAGNLAGSARAPPRKMSSSSSNGSEDSAASAASGGVWGRLGGVLERR